MEKRNKIVGIAILAGVLLVVLGIFAVNQVKAQSGGAIQIAFQGSILEAAKEWKQLSEILGFAEFEPTDEPSFGSQPGPDSFNEIECHNGICKAFVTHPIIATSSVICILPSPFEAQATATVDRISVNITRSLEAIVPLDISTTTDAKAQYGSTLTGGAGAGTSSPAFVYSYEVAADGKAQILWTPGFQATSSNSGVVAVGRGFTSTGDGNGENPFIILGDEVVNAVIASSTPGIFGTYISGTCQAEFTKI